MFFPRRRGEGRGSTKGGVHKKQTPPHGAARYPGPARLRESRPHLSGRSDLGGWCTENTTGPGMSRNRMELSTGQNLCPSIINVVEGKSGNSSMCAENSIAFLGRAEGQCRSNWRAGELEILAAGPSFLEFFWSLGASCLGRAQLFLWRNSLQIPPLAHTFPRPPHNAMVSPRPLALDTTPPHDSGEFIS